MHFERVNGTNTENGRDYTIYGNDGTDIGTPKWTSNLGAGVGGSGAYDFDGSNDYISVPSSELLNLSETMSIAFWVKYNGTPGTYDMIASKTTSSSWNDGYGIYFSGSTVKFWVTSFSANVASSSITPTNWNHVVGTYDGSKVRIFVNDIEGTPDTYSGAISKNSADLEIGRGSSNSYNLKGILDDLYMYNYSITYDEIKNLYYNRTDLIVGNTTRKNDLFQACITPNDGTDDGLTKCSENLSVVQFDGVDNLTLNSSSNTNTTFENLTTYFDKYVFPGITLDTPITWLNFNRSYPPNPNDFDMINVVLKMPFDNYTHKNDTFKDFSYIGNNATNSSVAWNVTGGHNGYGAFEFDGSTSEILIPNTTSAGLGKHFKRNFTISTWIKPESIVGQDTIIGVESTSTYGSSDFEGITFELNVGTPRVYIATGNAARDAISGTGKLIVDQWVHFAIVREDNNLTFYYNGSKNLSSAITDSDIRFNEPEYPGFDSIGVTWNTYSGKGRYFDGSIDDLFLFNVSLSDSQIQELYNNSVSVLIQNETFTNDIWSFCIIPNGNGEEGSQKCSDDMVILAEAASPPAAVAPIIDSIAINTTDPTTNNTNQNLTAHVNASDANGDGIKLIYDWKLNGSSIAVLNMPFEKITDTHYNATKDYSDYSNNGSEMGGAIFNLTGGYDGNGSFEFDGVDDFINVSHSASLNLTNAITIVAWVKTEGNGYVVVKDPPKECIADGSASTTSVSCSGANEDSTDATIDSCSDGGSAGSPDRIENIYLNASSIIGGNKINVTCEMNCYDGGDRYAILYNNASGWVNLSYGSCAGAGFNNVSLEVDVDNVAGTHYIRCWEDYNVCPSNSECCTSTYSDNDDINFTVTVAAAPAGKTDVPFILSTYNGGEFKIINNSVSFNASGGADINDSLWHHLAATYDGATMSLYVDGVLKSTNTSYSGSLPTNSYDVWIGRNYTAESPGFFNGTIDEVMILNISLSANQIEALYNNRTDLIVSQDTFVNDNWSFSVTPNDGTFDGDTNLSQGIVIQAAAGNTLPSDPELVLPLNDTTLTNRTPLFLWNNSNDADADTLTYHIQVDNDSDFLSPEINVTSIENGSTNTSYRVTDPLNVSFNYYWRVRANDSTGYGSYSNVSNFTLNSLLSISIINGTVDFGNLGLNGQANTTASGNISPFRLENNGNINANVTIYATNFFNSTDMPSVYYQFKIRENESGAYNNATTFFNWTNMTNVTGTIAVFDLNWTALANDFFTDIRVLVPPEEPATVKNSTVTFEIAS